MCKVMEKHSYVSKNLELLEFMVAKEPFNIQHRVAYIDELLTGDEGDVRMANMMLKEMRTKGKHSCAWSGPQGRCNSNTREIQLISRCGFISEIRTLDAKAPITTILDHAWDLFRSYPITRVIPGVGLVMYPIRYHPVTVYKYCYINSTDVPMEVWDRLTGAIGDPKHGISSAKVYSKRKKAVDDMSNAIVDVCRSIADLPPLQRQ